MLIAYCLSIILLAQEQTDKLQAQQIHETTYKLGETSQQLDQTETVAWGGIVIAVISTAMNVAQMINKRLADRDKAESDRLAQRDKLEFDSTIKDLRQKQKDCLERSEREEKELTRIKTEHKVELETIKKELSICNERHAKSDERLDEIMKLIVRRKIEMEDRIESKVHEIQAQIQELDRVKKDDTSVKIQALPKSKIEDTTDHKDK